MDKYDEEVVRAAEEAKKNEIRVEIHNLEIRKNSYTLLLSQLSQIISKLNSSKNSLVLINDDLKKFFLIDGSISDSDKIKLSQDNISSLLITLNETVIPQINSKINDFNSMISNLNSSL